MVKHQQEGRETRPLYPRHLQRYEPHSPILWSNVVAILHGSAMLQR